MDTATISINKPIPDFTLPDLDGNPHRPGDFLGRIVVLNFWSAECPHVERTDRELMARIKDWGEQVVLLAVASNANEPPEMLRVAATERSLPLVLHDPDHQVADLLEAVTTPHIFVLDQEGILRYQGAFDDLTFRKREVTRRYAVEAVDALLAGRIPEPAETPAYGCSVVRYLP